MEVPAATSTVLYDDVKYSQDDVTGRDAPGKRVAALLGERLEGRRRRLAAGDDAVRSRLRNALRHSRAETHARK
jgi:hypothetical protein